MNREILQHWMGFVAGALWVASTVLSLAKDYGYVR